MIGWSDAQYRTALDRLLADLDELLARYAWTDHHDDAEALHERIVLAREYIERASAAVTQGAGRPA